jgi:hypothetical protein
MSDDGSELKKCWWCSGFYRGPLREHICSDGSTHVDRQNKPTRDYDATRLELTIADMKWLKGMKIKV